VGNTVLAHTGETEEAVSLVAKEPFQIMLVVISSRRWQVTPGRRLQLAKRGGFVIIIAFGVFAFFRVAGGSECAVHCGGLVIIIAPAGFAFFRVAGGGEWAVHCGGCEYSVYYESVEERWCWRIQSVGGRQRGLYGELAWSRIE
jgi:hypothetical protein